MYTIGTSSLNQLRYDFGVGGQFADPNAYNLLQGKYVAFVCGKDEYDSGAVNHNTVLINGGSVLFVIEYAGNPPGVIQSIRMHGAEETVPGNEVWDFSGTYIEVTNAVLSLFNTLTTLSGYPQVLYAIQRGLDADINDPAVRKVDGLPWYSRDTEQLKIWDRSKNNGQGAWVLLTSSGLPFVSTDGIAIIGDGTAGSPVSFNCDLTPAITNPIKEYVVRCRMVGTTPTFYLSEVV